MRDERIELTEILSVLQQAKHIIELPAHWLPEIEHYARTHSGEPQAYYSAVARRFTARGAIARALHEHGFARDGDQEYPMFYSNEQSVMRRFEMVNGLETGAMEKWCAGESHGSVIAAFDRTIMSLRLRMQAVND